VADKPVVKKAVAKPRAAKSVAKAKPVVKSVAAKAVAPVVTKPAVQMAVAVAPAVAKPVVAAAPKVVAAPVPAKPIEVPPAEPVVVAALDKGKTVMTDTFTKAEETAKKFTADATERATEMFGDVSARAKTAMEKGSKSLEDMVEFSKGNLEAVVASGRVAAKGVQDIAKYSADYGRKAIEDGNATAKKFAAVKSPTEFFALQSEVTKKNLDAFVGEASKFSESYLKLLGEIVQPIQNRYAVAVEKVKSVVAA
jgi:phasin family protein